MTQRDKYMAFMAGWRIGAARLTIPDEYGETADAAKLSLFSEGWKAGCVAAKAASDMTSDRFGYKPLTIALAGVGGEPQEKDLAWRLVRMRPLPGACERVLYDIAEGRGTHHRCNGRSEYGARQSILMALRKRELIDIDNEMTSFGRYYIAHLEGDKEAT